MRFSIQIVTGLALLAGGFGCNTFGHHEAGRCDCDHTPTISCYYGCDSGCHAPVIATPVIKPVETVPIPVPNK